MSQRPSEEVQLDALDHLALMTKNRYASALARWDALLEKLRITDFHELTEEGQDSLLCELLHDMYAQGDVTMQESRGLGAALQKAYLHRKHCTASSWLLRTWPSQLPMWRAAPLPEGTAYALFTVLVDRGRLGAPVDPSAVHHDTECQWCDARAVVACSCDECRAQLCLRCVTWWYQLPWCDVGCLDRQLGLDVPEDETQRR